MKRTALLLAAIPAILSCSIKEDRAGCPCELTVVLAEAGGRDGEDLTLGISGLSDERIPGARIPEKVEKTVVKGTHLVTVYCGDGGMPRHGSIISVPLGAACGPLMARTESVECEDDRVVDTVRLRKQFISLGFRLDSSAAGVTVRSGWSGLDLGELSPVKGELRSVAKSIAPGQFEVLLPRQGDDKMVADILGGDGAVVQTLEVGRMLRGAGYDFSAENLDDALVFCEAASGAFYVTVLDWQKGADTVLDI